MASGCHASVPQPSPARPPPTPPPTTSPRSRATRPRKAPTSRSPASLPFRRPPGELDQIDVLRLECFSQRPERAGCSGLHRAERYALLLGDLRVAEPVEDREL